MLSNMYWQTTFLVWHLEGTSKRFCTIAWYFIAVVYGLWNLRYPDVGCPECCRKATILPTELDRHVCFEHIRGGMGFRGWIWIRRVGKHEQLHQSGWFIWSVCQMLSVQASCTSSLSRDAISIILTTSQCPLVCGVLLFLPIFLFSICMIDALVSSTGCLLIIF